MHGQLACINGDGETSRDFCYIDNAVQANILATEKPAALNQVYNVAFGERTTLNALFQMIRNLVSEIRTAAKAAQPMAVEGFCKNESLRNRNQRRSILDIFLKVPFGGQKAGFKFTL